MSQITWFAQTCYEAVIVGTENIETIGQTKIQNLATKFEQVLNHDIGGFSLSASYYNILDDQAAIPVTVPVVEAQINGTLSAFSGTMSVPMQHTLIGPQAAFVPGLGGDLTDFEILNGKQFDCFGVECGGSTGVPCPPAPC